MYAKRIILTCCFLFLLNVFLSGNDFTIDDINGIWVEKRHFSFMPNLDDRKSITFGICYNQFTITWNDKTKTGIFMTGPERNKILKIEISRNIVTIYYKVYYHDHDSKIVLEYMSRDLLKVISSIYDGSNPDYLCRVYDFAKKPQATGTINNTKVRFRTKPELTGYVWFYLDYREKVEILGISEEKQHIGDLEAYWYEIRINHKKYITEQDYGIDGWVFGAYVDVDDREALEEKLKKKK